MHIEVGFEEPSLSEVHFRRIGSKIDAGHSLKEAKRTKHRDLVLVFVIVPNRPPFSFAVLVAIHKNYFRKAVVVIQNKNFPKSLGFWPLSEK
jgi:hypothetical protein